MSFYSSQFYFFLFIFLFVKYHGHAVYKYNLVYYIFWHCLYIYIFWIYIDTFVNNFDIKHEVMKTFEKQL